MDRIKDLIEQAQWLPFMLSAGTSVKLSPARLIETMIIAVLAGAMSVWATTIVIKEDITHIKDHQNKYETWYKDTHDKMDKMTAKIYEHEH